VLLPWLYCPLAWCVYNFIFQVLGDGLILGCVLLLAWSPLLYTHLGDSNPRSASQCGRRPAAAD